MAQVLPIKIKGLQTNSNQLSGVEPGALSVAKNIVIDRDDVAESRRGFSYLALPPVSSAARFDRLTSYQSHKIARRLDDSTLLYYVDGAGWTSYAGTYSHPDADFARIKFMQAAGNLYFTTSNGVKVLDNYLGPVYSTGMPQGLDGVATVTGSSGFMSNDTQVAYRIVWGSKDANNNLYLGAPSQRIIATNSSGGTRDVSLTFTIPEGITTLDFYQIYRSKESSSAADEPNDELQLVYENNPTSGEITAKAITKTDATSVSLMGASLYTNSSQEGLSEANAQPPQAKDIELFKGYAFFANIQTKHQITISLLSVSGTGLVVDDTITINSVVYTAKAAETIASAQFQVTTTGSASQNIEDTAKSLVKVINQYSGNTSIYAYYESGFQDLPGVIRIEKRTIDGSGFTVAVSRAAAWDVNDGTSDNEMFINGLMWGKQQQPEHVPISHLELVGAKNYAIRRIIALRDALFILKDDGIFRLTGDGGNWSVDPLDTSTKIIAPDSAVVVNNMIYCLSDQGIVAISDVGVEVKSRPIENLIQGLISENYDNLKKLSFGINYETDRKYILFTIKESGDTSCTQAFVYNTFTNAWTTWEKNAVHGFVDSTDDRLYLADAATKNIFKERKDFLVTDYSDEVVSGYSITSSTDQTVFVNDVSGITVGDVLFQSSTKYSIVTSIDFLTSSVQTSIPVNWSAGSVDLYRGIDCDLEFVNQSMQNPGMMKHFQEVAWLFREQGFDFATVSFYTDLSGGYQGTTINGAFGSNLWGAGAWGLFPWGGVQRPKPIRVFVPREKSRGSILSVRLSVRNAFARWSLNGFSSQFEYVSERMERE